MSGFTGSAGTALITTSEALLWTDGRYFLQASQQLSKDWTLMKMGEKGVPDLADWLSTTLKPGNVVGVDPHLISASAAKSLIKKFEPLGIKLKAVSKNPVDIVWGASRPPPPISLVKIHEISIAGETYQSKISKVQELLTKANVVAVVVSMLDEVRILAFLYYIFVIRRT